MRKPSENVVRQCTIDIGHMEWKPDYFGEALSICDEFGLRPIMELQQDFDEELVG